jgi:hypothetical protein
MITFLILITIAFAISSILLLTKNDFPKIEKILKRISFYSFIGVAISLLLLIFEFRLKGTYTTPIIALTFVVSTILLFGLTKNTLTKVLSGLLTIPFFVFGILSLIWELPIAFFNLIALPFEPPMAKFIINENHNVEVRVGGFFACGESLVVTKTMLAILDKQKYVGNNSCVRGIHKIETIELNEHNAEFLIHHDGETEFDNPYKYKAEIKNVQ